MNYYKSANAAKTSLDYVYILSNTICDQTLKFGGKNIKPLKLIH